MSKKTGVGIACVCVVAAATIAVLSGPSLSVDPSTISFAVHDGLNPPPQTLSIETSREGIDWAAEGDAPWLTLNPSSSNTDAGSWLTLSADIAGMHPGEYSTTVTISAPDVRRPSRVPVTLAILETQETLATREAVGGDADSVEIYYGEQPFYSSGPASTQISLVNNDSATDVTWDELLQFIESDRTQEGAYIEGVYMCGSFAQDLHNNAEQTGIRAAWVAVHFEDRSESHAMNAFIIVDRGLVFVDCTGARLRPEPIAFDGEDGTTSTSLQTGHDKLAYVQIGSEYGLISADVAASPSYAFYEDYRQKIDEYAARVEEYNRNVEEYNRETAGKTYYVGTGEYSRIMAWYDSLKIEERELDRLRQELGDWLWEPLGIVAHIEIYW